MGLTKGLRSISDDHEPDFEPVMPNPLELYPYLKDELSMDAVIVLCYGCQLASTTNPLLAVSLGRDFVQDRLGIARRAYQTALGELADAKLFEAVDGKSKYNGYRYGVNWQGLWTKLCPFEDWPGDSAVAAPALLETMRLGMRRPEQPEKFLHVAAYLPSDLQPLAEDWARAIEHAGGLPANSVTFEANQLQAIRQLAEQYGKDRVGEVVAYLTNTSGDQGAPRVVLPVDVKRRFASIAVAEARFAKLGWASPALGKQDVWGEEDR